MSGRFVVQKSSNHFSAIAIDHCHEQNNCTIKGSGGAVGLTESPAALRRWMVAGPELARLISEFENSELSKQCYTVITKHHDQIPSVQNACVMILFIV